MVSDQMEHILQHHLVFKKKAKLGLFLVKEHNNDSSLHSGISSCIRYMNVYSALQAFFSIKIHSGVIQMCPVDRES